MINELSKIELPEKKTGLVSQKYIALCTLLFGPLCGALCVEYNFMASYNFLPDFTTRRFLGVVSALVAFYILDKVSNILIGFVLLHIMAALVLVLLNRLLNGACIEKKIESGAVFFNFKPLFSSFVFYGLIWYAAMTFFSYKSKNVNTRHYRDNTSSDTYFYEKKIKPETDFVISDFTEPDLGYTDENKSRRRMNSI